MRPKTDQSNSRTPNLTRGWRAILVGGAIAAVSVALRAQEATKEFVPADTVAKQELPSGPLIYAAYAFVWAAVLMYVLVLWRKLGRVERELSELNRKIRK